VCQSFPEIRFESWDINLHLFRKSIRTEREGLQDESFNQKSWEAEIWFGRDDPGYLRHNLYEEEVAKATLFIPELFLRAIKDLSVKIVKTL
jgi:hypothetical protein